MKKFESGSSVYKFNFHKQNKKQNDYQIEP